MVCVSQSIVSQNIEKNLFVAAFPGEIVIGFVKRVSVDENDYVFENYGSFTRSNLQDLANCLQNIARLLCAKKGKNLKNEEYDSMEATLCRNETSLLVKNKRRLNCTFDLSSPEIFKNFCDAIFAVVFAILLPTDNQYNACYRTNFFFRETFRSLTLPETALESAQEKLGFPAPIYHYLRRNLAFLQFAHIISTLANAK